MDAFYDLVERALAHELDAMSGEALHAYQSRQELDEMSRVERLQRLMRVTPEPQ